MKLKKMYCFRLHIIFGLISLALSASGQTGFSGVSNGESSSIFIGENSSLFINGSLTNKSKEHENIKNEGTISITDSLVNYAGVLFESSSVGIGYDGQDVVTKGNINLVGSQRQIIHARSPILFANLFIRDTVELHSDINVLGTLKLNHWSEPSRLLLNEHTLKMYRTDENLIDSYIGGVIEGECADHFITSDSLGKIRMRKEYKHQNNDPSFEIQGLASMGLGITLKDKTVDRSGSVIVERYHTSEVNAALGGIRKYFSIYNNGGSGFDTIYINYHEHDLMTEHYDEESLRLYYSENAGESYKFIESERLDSVVISIGEPQIHIDVFRYTVAAHCVMPGFKLVATPGEALCKGSSVTITPQWSFQSEEALYYIWYDDNFLRDEKFEITDLQNDTVIWIKAINTRNGCEAHDTIRIRALPIPEAQIAKIDTEYLLRCISKNWEFNTEFIPDHNYRWDFGDGDVAFGAIVTKDYTTAGNYSVKLTVENEYGCVATDYVEIRVVDLPEPYFYTKIIAEGRLQFIDSTNYNSINEKEVEWMILDDVYTGSPVVQFPSFGDYPIIHTVSNERCTVTYSKDVTVSEIGILGFRIENTALCQGTELQFINESIFSLDGITFEWDFGDGASSDNEHPTHTYNDEETTNYIVTLRAIDPNNTGWSASYAGEITVQRPPRINWGGVISTCTDYLYLQPFEQEPYLSYLWNNSATTNTLYVSMDGTYSLQLTDYYGCTSFEEVEIKLSSTVEPTISDTEHCGSLLLDAGNPGSDYKWNDGTTERTLLVEKSGTYEVVVTQSNGCVGIKAVNIEIKERPEVKIIGPTDLCEGTTATLFTAEEANTSYLWNTGNATSSINISRNGLYRVTATNLTNLCTASDSVFVIGRSAPVVNLGVDKNVCLGQETVLEMNQYNYATVEWWKEGDNYIHHEHIFAVRDTGVYYLRVTLENGCSTTDRIRFGGFATPMTVDFLAASHSNVGDTVVFIDLSYPEPITERYWEIGTGYRLNDSTIFKYVFWNQGVFDVKLTVDNGGCIISKTKTVTVGTNLKIGNDDSNNVQGSDNEVYSDDTFEKLLYIEPSKILDVITMPNPSDGDFQVKVRLEHPSPLLVRVFSITGQAVKSFVVPQQTEDMLFRTNLTNLSTGVYLLQLCTDNDVKTIRIVIDR